MLLEHYKLINSLSMCRNSTDDSDNFNNDDTQQPRY